MTNQHPSESCERLWAFNGVDLANQLHVLEAYFQNENISRTLFVNNAIHRPAFQPTFQHTVTETGKPQSVAIRVAGREKRKSTSSNFPDPTSLSFGVNVPPLFFC